MINSWILWLVPQWPVEFSLSIVSDFLQPHGLQHARLLCPSPTRGVISNSKSSSWWCHPTISSSVIPFSSCLQPLSFRMSQLFTSGGQSIGASAAASVLPMNIQYWFPLGWTDLISLLSNRFSIVFSSTTVQKHQFFGTQLSLLSNSHIHTWLLEKITTTDLTRWTFVSKVMSLLFNMPSRFVIAFLPRSKCLLISRLQSLTQKHWNPFRWIQVILKPWLQGRRA